MKFGYYKQLFAQGWWKVRLSPVGAHSGQNSNVHTWIIKDAFGGSTPKTAQRCQVTHIFTGHECKPVPFSKVPKTWQRVFRREALTV